MSSIDIVMQLVVCKIFINLLNLGEWEDEKHYESTMKECSKKTVMENKCDFIN